MKMEMQYVDRFTIKCESFSTVKTAGKVGHLIASKTQMKLKTSPKFWYKDSSFETVSHPSKTYRFNTIHPGYCSIAIDLFGSLLWPNEEGRLKVLIMIGTIQKNATVTYLPLCYCRKRLNNAWFPTSESFIFFQNQYLIPRQNVVRMFKACS